MSTPKALHLSLVLVVSTSCYDVPTNSTLGTDGGPAAGADSSVGARHHPVGFASALQHGPELKKQAEDCRACHGQDLAGTTLAPSCDGCHTPSAPGAWRNNCTYCHGGTDNPSGAPPRSLDESQARTIESFAPHRAHVTQRLAKGFDCTECHVKATDVLSNGHVFDSSRGRAEVDFGSSLSPQGTWNGNGTCSNLYCHGNGRTDVGTVSVNDGARSCSSCHAGMESNANAWAAMSGQHALHLGLENLTCGDCHASVSPAGVTIADPTKHVNGQREVSFVAAGFAMNASQSCTGSCHGRNHSDTAWKPSGGTVHPPGFAASNIHGPEMELQRQDCRTCHGPDLRGGVGPSCDTCHTLTSPGSWRASCTYCHGGDQDSTGAPPQDLGALAGAASTSFVAHRAHVATAMAAPIDCVECHIKPSDVMTVNHAFDVSPDKAEVTMAAGKSPLGTYDGAGTCATMYCHGNGRGDTGLYRDGSPALACSGCHPSQATPALWATMSGDHARHLRENVRCEECHNSVTLNGTTIAAPALHIDKQKQVAFNVATISYVAATRRCTGPCHNENHNNLTW